MLQGSHKPGALGLNNVTTVTNHTDECSSLSITSDDEADDCSCVAGPMENHTGCSPPQNSKRQLSAKSRRASLAPPPEDNPEQETKDEIERSRASHDCNLAALNLVVAPQGLPMNTLTKLSLSENKLTSLPEALFSGGNGQNLVDLDVNSNMLRSLPASLFFLPRLSVLMLNHNQLTGLPAAVTAPELPPGTTFLLALERVGLEFNALKEFPVCFFRHCRHLREVLLGQNERLLEKEVPFSALLQSPAGKAGAAGSQRNKVVLRLDNRPRLMRQIQKENWSTAAPWIDLSLHKIYPDKVLDFLYLGSMRTAQTVTVYHDLDIRYVLTVGRDLEVLIEPGMKHKVLLVDDYPGADITPLFSEAFAFIDAARAAKKGILIHCFAGLSRSVTIAAAYIMKVKHMTCDQAMSLIKEARPAAHPNEGFLNALKANESKLMEGYF